MPAPRRGGDARLHSPPRTPDGHPDLQGIWQVLNTAAWDIEDHNARLGVPAGHGVVEGGPIPYQPWALARKQENFQNRATLDPEGKCYLLGVPRMTYMPYPFRIVQQRDKITILYEYLGAVRFLYMNGNPHPKGPIEWFMGDSRARWEGNTLVVDVVHFTDQTWLDRAGNFHSEALHVVERYTPTGPDHMLYEVTDRGPEGLHAALEDEHAAVPPPGGERRAPGVRVPVLPARRHAGTSRTRSRSTDLEASVRKPLLRGHNGRRRRFSVLALSLRPVTGQARFDPKTPKLPMARTWIAYKATLPPYRPPRTPDGVPDFQGTWGGPGGAGGDDIEEHGYVDVTTPPQESFVSDPPDGRIPYTPWALDAAERASRGVVPRLA